MSKSSSRIKTRKITPRVDTSEKTWLEQKAATFGISLGDLCLQIVINKTTPKSQIDVDVIRELAATRADLGRVAGLLKAWLGGEAFPKARTPLSCDAVVDLLHKIERSKVSAVNAINYITGKKQ